MKESKDKTESIFWTTVAITFALLVHNGTEPLFLIAYSLIPLLIIIFYYKRNLWPIVFYLLFFGILGRYTRYFREGYSSDVLPTIKDFIGYFINGKNVYQEIVMSQTGVTPFAYLPFSIYWYIPARLFHIDFRFFEMVVSSLVPVLFFLYGFATNNKWKILPTLSIVSLTPFLLDLSADGSNDNSAIFLLLSSVIFLLFSKKNKNIKYSFLSAIILGLAISFKHYVFFYLLFFVPFYFKNNNFLPTTFKKYFFFIFLTFGIISLPFILSSPTGFLRSLIYIEVVNQSHHAIWGWNIWVATKTLFGFIPTLQQMWLIRTACVILVITLLFRFYNFDRFNKVFIASSLVMLTYLIFSQWTTYAYFTFLLPLLSLSAFKVENKEIF